MTKRRQPADSAPEARPRERVSSFSSTTSTEFDAIEHDVDRDDAAAQTLSASKKKKCADEATTTPATKAINVDHDLEFVCASIVETCAQQVEEDTMLDLIGSLQNEMYEVEEQAAKHEELRKELLWDVVATPQMFKEFSATVASAPRVSCSTK